MSLNCWIWPSVTQYPTEMEKCLRKLQFPHLLCMWGIFLMAAMPQPFAKKLQEHDWHVLLGSPLQPFPVSSVSQHLPSRTTLGHTDFASANFSCLTNISWAPVVYLIRLSSPLFSQCPLVIITNGTECFIKILMDTWQL